MPDPNRLAIDIIEATVEDIVKSPRADTWRVGDGASEVLWARNVHFIYKHKPVFSQDLSFLSRKLPQVTSAARDKPP